MSQSISCIASELRTGVDDVSGEQLPETALPEEQASRSAQASRSMLVFEHTLVVHAGYAIGPP